jgi:hypothetical protein
MQVSQKGPMDGDMDDDQGAGGAYVEGYVRVNLGDEFVHSVDWVAVLERMT